MDRYTIDRVEDGAWAVLEDEAARTFQVPLSWLPAGSREGDLVTVSQETSESASRLLRVELDPAGREERLDQARRLRERLPRGPKGDVSL